MKLMKQKTTMAIALLCLLSTGAAFAQDAQNRTLTVRTWQLKHKDADRAAAVVKSLVSASGSVSIQPSSNSLVVTDSAANIDRIMGAIEKFDVPARSFRVQLDLVSAARVASATPVPRGLESIAGKLSGVLRFNSFERAGQMIVQGKEGDPIVAMMDGGYRAEFRFGEFDPVTNSIRISDFQLSRQSSAKDGAQLDPLLKTSLNLKVGQTIVLGASRQPDSNRALMLVLVAQPLAQ